MIRWIRRLVGLALLGWSAWTILRPWWPRPSFEARFGYDVGAPTGIRIVPLSPAETAAAAALERAELLKR